MATPPQDGHENFTEFSLGDIRRPHDIQVGILGSSLVFSVVLLGLHSDSYLYVFSSSNILQALFTA
jgi:hypothetical protein